MEATSLQLFNDKEYKVNGVNLAAPVLEEVLKSSTPELDSPKPIKKSRIRESLQDSLDKLFPEQQHEEKDIQKSTEILGDLALEFSPEQLKDIVTEIKYLSESWLDDFERKIFNGLTLQEMLHEKGDK